MIPRPDFSTGGYSDKDFEFIRRINEGFSGVRFVFGRKFAFRPPRTVVIGPREPKWKLLLLHELGHVVSGRYDFRADVERVRIELLAWEEARKIARQYKIPFSEELMQKELETYREWLHQKSRCPKCGLTRFQTPDSRYHCPRCESFEGE